MDNRSIVQAMRDRLPDIVEAMYSKDQKEKRIMIGIIEGILCESQDVVAKCNICEGMWPLCGHDETLNFHYVPRSNR